MYWRQAPRCAPLTCAAQWMSTRPPADPTEQREIDEAIAASLASFKQEEAARATVDSGFELVETPSSSTSTPCTASAEAPSAVQRAASKAAAKALAPRPKVVVRKYYSVWSAPDNARNSVGVHYCYWPEVGVPNGRLAGSRWCLKSFTVRAEAEAYWLGKRPGDPLVRLGY